MRPSPFILFPALAACAAEVHQAENPMLIDETRWQEGFPEGAGFELFVTESMAAEIVEQVDQPVSLDRSWHARKVDASTEYWVKILLGEPPVTEYFSLNLESGLVKSEGMQISMEQSQ